MEKLEISFGYEAVVATPAVLDRGSEVSDYHKYEITSGAGQLTKAGAVVRGNVSGRLAVDVNVTTVSQSRMQEFQRTITSTLTRSQQTELEKHRQERGNVGWFWGLFGIGAGKSSDEYQKEKRVDVTIQEDKLAESMKELLTQEQRACRVSGTFDVKSNSNVPTEVFLYAQMLVIKTESGETLKVFNNTAIAADKSGNTKDCAIEGDNSLNIIEL